MSSGKHIIKTRYDVHTRQIIIDIDHIGVGGGVEEHLHYCRIIKSMGKNVMENGIKVFKPNLIHEQIQEIHDQLYSHSNFDQPKRIYFDFVSAKLDKTIASDITLENGMIRFMIGNDKGNMQYSFKIDDAYESIIDMIAVFLEASCS